MEQRGFEAVDAEQNPLRFAAYLEVVGDLRVVRDYRERALALLAPAPGERLLEIGCGTGENALDLARRVLPGGTVAGIDASVTMISEARSNAAKAGLPIDLRVGDAHALDFPDGQFDAVAAERVLQHVGDPARAVAEMARVCRPGGRVVVSEPDWGTLTIDLPDGALTGRVLQALCAGVRQAWIGRQLPRYFRQAGLMEIAVEPAVLVLESIAQAEHLLGLRTRALEAFQDGRLTAADVAAWIAALERAEKAGSSFTSLTGFTVRGRKA